MLSVLFSSSCFSLPASSQQEAVAIFTPSRQLRRLPGSELAPGSARQRRSNSEVPFVQQKVRMPAPEPPASQGNAQFIPVLSFCQRELLAHVCSVDIPVRGEEWQRSQQSPPRGTASRLARVLQLTFFSLGKAPFLRPLLSSLKQTFSFTAETPKLSVLGDTTGPGHGVRPCPTIVFSTRRSP